MRLDQALVQRQLISTRSQAGQLIKEGAVSVNGSPIKKPSFQIREEDEIHIAKENLWVGRGAEKLAGAHADFSLDFKDKIVADMGASTGGFVEYSLYHGAKKVYAVDVGHDQLAQKLRDDSRVINREGTNIKNGVELEELCDLIVVDLSFISLTHVLEPIRACAKENGELVILVKPQFEVGRESLGKKGLVRDQSAVEEALEKIKETLQGLEMELLKVSPCRVKGNKSGNQEYFFYVRNHWRNI